MSFSSSSNVMLVLTGHSPHRGSCVSASLRVWRLLIGCLTRRVLPCGELDVVHSYSSPRAMFWKTVASLESLWLFGMWFLKWGQGSAHSKLILFLVGRERSWAPSRGLWFGFPVWLWKQEHPRPCAPPALFPLASQMVLAHMYVLISHLLNLRRRIPLCCCRFSGFLSGDSSCLLSPQLRVCLALPQLPLPGLKAGSWGNHGAHHCFLSSLMLIDLKPFWWFCTQFQSVWVFSTASNSLTPAGCPII